MEERQAILLAAPTWDATQTRVLDAADDLIRRRGMSGVTIAELARRSELSRPTIYRSWNDADDVVRAALLRRITVILDGFPAPAVTRTLLVDDILRFIELFRTDAVYGELLDAEPESFTRYTLQRVGSSQRMILQWLTAAIGAAQRDGSVRQGEPSEISVMLLLIAQSAVLSHGTVADLIDEQTWERELRAALDGHLRP
ncbi:putative HTH-type transcriptional regulator Rv2250c [Microbacterium oxydans]|uniref:Bacterial regulatory protein, tetR family n=1 Tax=Microbacterium oxydans TaxID=82380 RepID=A0A0F0L3W7_9MICO|nr:TetR/AcrR family transcriptional regulator [Microbacterium oxydans]KJL27843.1 Bacterial regulatory protein, tetR family [Microbacterium oxydans]CAH0178579.1 putative HTH-type transcriptional regulator Rv2250c [Microbacterium oxydans]